VTTTTPATCNIRSLSSSPAVTAFSTVKQSTFGCFHPEAAGVLPQDVHVIDLKTSELPQDVHVIDLKTSELSHSRRRRRETSAPRVEVDLVPSSGENLRFPHVSRIYLSLCSNNCLLLLLTNRTGFLAFNFFLLILHCYDLNKIQETYLTW
jgi:hypothetical protein